MPLSISENLAPANLIYSLRVGPTSSVCASVV